MLLPSHLPEPHLWPEIERHHLEADLCTQAALPHRLFCGARAVALTPAGPRCRKHLPAEHKEVLP